MRGGSLQTSNGVIGINGTTNGGYVIPVDTNSGDLRYVDLSNSRLGVGFVSGTFNESATANSGANLTLNSANTNSIGYATGSGDTVGSITDAQSRFFDLTRILSTQTGAVDGSVGTSSGSSLSRDERGS